MPHNNQIQGGSSASGLFTQEMHRHQDSFSLEFVIYSNKTNILLVGMALQDVLICVRDRVVSRFRKTRLLAVVLFIGNIDSRPLW
jgi:hypothetical protein